MRYRSICIGFAASVVFCSGIRNLDAQTGVPAPAVSANFSVMAGECRLETTAQGIVKYVGDCYLERQNESSGAISSNNPARRLYCFNDYRLTAKPNAQAVGGPTADSWIGCSMCVGERCQSFLIPGFPSDVSALGQSAAIKAAGFNAAADPVVEAGPDGTFYLAFLGFARGTTINGSSAPNAGIFVQPIVDLENTEKDPLDSLAFAPQFVVELTNQQLVDKPDVAFVLDSAGRTFSMNAQTMETFDKNGNLVPGKSIKKNNVPGGTILSAYTTFNGLTDKNARSKIQLASHDLTGGSRDRIVRLDESQHVDSGVALAIDRANPANVYLFWRRFATPNLEQSNAIVLAASSDGGASFGKAAVIFSPVNFGDFPRLPQPGYDTLVLARSTGFVTASVAPLGTAANPLYLCWSQQYANEGGQIVCSTSQDKGLQWSPPQRIDPKLGNQIQPVLDCAAGQCSLAWYDMRNDLAGTTASLPADPKPLPDKYPVHTVDVRMTQWEPSSGTLLNPHCYQTGNAGCSSSFQVSRYPLTVNSQGNLVQLQANPLSPLTNCNGECAFFGDYMDVFYQKWVRDVSPSAIKWKYNLDAAGPRNVWASWTDNRQIKFPPWINGQRDWTNFSAPNTGCTQGQVGLHNQEVYTAVISPDGFDVACPRCTKPVTVGDQRTFLLVLQNLTSSQIRLEVEILPATGMTASFRQDTSVTGTAADISPLGKKIRTVFVNCQSGCGVPLTVNVRNVTSGVIGPWKPVYLNAVSAVFPEGAPDAATEIHDLSLLNATTPNLSLLNIDSATLSLLNQANALSLLNLSLLNESVSNLSLLNLGEVNLSLLNQDPTNLSLLNQAANLSLLNNTLNLSLLNTAVGIKTWDLNAKDTNTTSGYDVTLLSEQPQVPVGLDAFLAVVRTRDALSFDGNCNLISTPSLAGQELLASVPLSNSSPSAKNGEILSPSGLEEFKRLNGYQNLSLLNQALDDSTFLMAPGETIHVTLAVQKKDGTASPGEIATALAQFNVFASAQAASSSGILSHTPVPQTITWGNQPPASLSYGDSVGLSATSSSGQSVTISAGPSGVCQVSGSVLTGISVGTCSVMASQAGGGDFLPVTALTITTITPRPITATADAKSKVYGSADPVLTYRITSGTLASPDTFPAAFSGSLTRVAGEFVGSYPINQGTLSLGGNYTLKFVGADLTITAVAITVTASAQTKVYGTADPYLTYAVSSGALIAGDVFTGALARAPGEAAGTYAVSQGTLALNGNYSITFVGANLTITKRPVTVTADAQSKVYGGTDPALTYQITSGSLVSVDAFSGALIRDAGESAGIYAIRQGTLSLGDNYLLTFVGANFVITKGSVTISAFTASPSTLEAGLPVTFTVTVTANPPSPGPPAGSVEFWDGNPGSGLLLGTATLSGTTASLSISTLSAGTHTIYLRYMGDGNFASSETQQQLTITVRCRFDGFYPKLGPAAVGSLGTSVIYGPYNVGSTVALKWALFDVNSQFYSGDINAATGQSNAKIELVGAGASRYTLVTPDTVPGATVFRIDMTKPQYIFNWDTSKALTGTGGTIIPSAGTYTLIVTDADGGVHSVTLLLK